MIKFKNYKGVGIMLFSCVLFFLVSISYDFYNQEKQEPNIIIDRNTFISGKVTSIHKGRGLKDVCIGKEGCYGMIWAINYNYTPNRIISFIEIGDSLHKKSGSYEVEVFRGEEEYNFTFLKKIGVESSSK